MERVGRVVAWSVVAWSVVAAGLAVLVGWCLGVPFLTSVGRGYASMKPNAASSAEH